MMTITKKVNDRLGIVATSSQDAVKAMSISNEQGVEPGIDIRPPLASAAQPPCKLRTQP